MQLSDLQVLVVDDFADFRQAIRRMLEQLGVASIDQASDGEKAISLLQKKRYDLVLSDYNLGDNKDGQQILEEVRHKQLLPHNSIYLMVTAENTSEMVMGALEYQPDGYLTKPFSKDALHLRVTRSLKRKQVLCAIDQALDQQNYSKAIALCDELIASKPALAPMVHKTKGQVLYLLGEYQKAADLYQMVLQEKPLPWATLGLARSLFQLQQYEEAEKILRKTIAQYPRMVESYDWLGKIHMACENYEDAQKVFQSGIQISPKAILRQRMLAEAAERNEDWQVADRAWKRAVQLGVHSVHRSPDDYYRRAWVLVSRSQVEGGLNMVRGLADVPKLFRDLRKIYSGFHDIQAQAWLVEGLVEQELGNTDCSDFVRRAEQHLIHYEAELNPDLKASMVEAFRGLGFDDQADALLKKTQVA
ncbi:response regulator [Pelagibaculum spongiae]|uniref:Response regulatory domain-containing protein n=1 Tax=Pelagibaculum spongiae TaxID=2080658 RepID=A0A2V1GW90_9GAMM|nr:response regulator [Pelagibaculum spongiae]PVZ64983.1 hypothetical protein DC094_19175 [Pelagibaculum spongiae]